MTIRPRQKFGSQHLMRGHIRRQAKGRTCATEGLGEVQEIRPQQDGICGQKDFEGTGIAVPTGVHEHDGNVEAERNRVHPIPEGGPVLPPVHLHVRTMGLYYWIVHQYALAQKLSYDFRKFNRLGLAW